MAMRRPSVRFLLIHVALIAAFGIWVPWVKGSDFTDPVLLASYACIGLLFSGPAAAQIFGEARPASRGELVRGLAISVLYGEFMAVSILLAGFATLYISQRHGYVAPPDLLSLATAALLGLSGSLALACTAAWIALRFSSRTARNALRVIFLGLLCLFFFRARWLPEVAGKAAIIALLIPAALSVPLKKEVR
jgi:hypothetical protein